MDLLLKKRISTMKRWKITLNSRNPNMNLDDRYEMKNSMLLDMRLHCYFDWHAHIFFVFSSNYILLVVFFSPHVDGGEAVKVQRNVEFKNAILFFLSHEIIFCHELNGNTFVHGGQARLNVTRVTKYVYNLIDKNSHRTMGFWCFFCCTLEKMFQLESNKWKKKYII